MKVKETHTQGTGFSPYIGRKTVGISITQGKDCLISNNNNELNSPQFVSNLLAKWVFNR